MKVICQTDKSFYQKNMTTTHKQIVQANLTTITGFHQNLISLDDKNKHIYNIIIIIAVIIFI